MLRQLSRDPFIEVLQLGLDNKPTPNDIRMMASEKPLEWARFVKMFADLTGYATKTEVKKDITVMIQQMTDEQLDEAIKKVEHGEIIEISDFVEVSK